MSKKAQLSETHWKAIELIADGKHSLKEVAQLVGLSPTTLYNLYEGNDAAGGTGTLFQAEIRKLDQKHLKRIKSTLVENKAISLRLMNDFLKRKLATDYVSDEDIKTICTVYNSLTKSGIGVEINNTSFSYIKGLSAEELMHEFNRLTSLAKGPSYRGAVSNAGSRIAGRISSDSGSNGGSDEE